MMSSSRTNAYLMILTAFVVMLFVKDVFFNIKMSQYTPKSTEYPEEYIEKGMAIALPSIPATEEEEKAVVRKIYGGKGDKSHLGGFTSIDYEGLSREAWKVLMEQIGVKSVLDVGCGKGISTTFFDLQGLDVMCVEGSHDAVEQTLLPNPEKQLVEHDFSRGPCWPPKTIDAVWCVEFLEHVGRNYHKNYFPAFQKAALVFATHSNWGGWHHVEVHDDDWWRTKFEFHGFVYSEYLTKMMRAAAARGRQRDTLPNGKNYVGLHISHRMLVFINPKVASLPQHDHLLSEYGCYQGKANGVRLNRECGNKEETSLPESYKPIHFNETKIQIWEELVMKHLNNTQKN